MSMNTIVLGVSATTAEDNLLRLAELTADHLAKIGASDAEICVDLGGRRHKSVSVLYRGASYEIYTAEVTSTIFDDRYDVEKNSRAFDRLMMAVNSRPVISVSRRARTVDELLVDLLDASHSPVRSRQEAIVFTERGPRMARRIG